MPRSGEPEPSYTLDKGSQARGNANAVGMIGQVIANAFRIPSQADSLVSFPDGEGCQLVLPAIIASNTLKMCILL